MNRITNISMAPHRFTAGRSPAATGDQSSGQAPGVERPRTDCVRPESPGVAQDRGAMGPGDRQAMKDFVAHLNTMLRDRSTPEHVVSLAFNEDAEDPVIEVRDDKTGRVIAQFPPESLVHLRQRLREFSGLMLDEKS